MDDQIFEALVEEFYLESRERLGQIEEALVSIEGASSSELEKLLVVAKRELHTLKGNSGMMGLSGLQEAAHRLEDQVVELEGPAGVAAILTGVDAFRRQLDMACHREEEAEAAVEEVGGGVQESVRVSFHALDGLVDLLSEMVIFRNRLASSLDRGLAHLDRRQRGSEVWRDVESSHLTLSKTLEEVQSGVMQLRMVPLGSLFGQLKRIVYDESSAAGKHATFSTAGGDTPLDKALLEVASEAMGHLIRNAIVHGLESPEERRQAGKDANGFISVTALAHAEEVTIDIEDDGRGIDHAALVAKAREVGFDVPDGIELQTLLSLPGLTTRDTADRSSGRGMGMAAVMESVRRRGGQVEVQSKPTKGTRFRLRLPLTAAILRALLVQCDGDVYAIPLSSVQETVWVGREQRNVVNDAAVFRWRGGLVPLLDLGLAFDTSETGREAGYVVLIEAEGKYRGILVDALSGIQDIVVKGLDEVMGRPTGLAGCTILGDGKVVLILDPQGLTALSPFLEQAV